MTGRSASDRNAPTLLVGREREQALLWQQLTSTLDGRGGLVLTSGEAGIGKTALAEDLAAQAEEAGALVLWGRAYDLSVTPPYGPWLEILHAYPQPDGLPPLPAFVVDVEELAKVGSQETLFAVMRDFFQAVAARRPLLLILDDLHWADQASLEFLRFLARHVASQPILMLATYRSDELHRRHPLYALLPLLVREAGPERLELQRLSDADRRALIEQRYQLPEAEASRLADYLRDHAEGNPLFAGELLRTLEETRVLVREEQGWRLGHLGQVQVPPLLLQVIESRLSRLDVATRELLQLAAVIGQEVPLALWQPVSDASDAALAAAIEQGQAAFLIEEVPGSQNYRFRHALLREALYQEVIAPHRRLWHRTVAEALDAMPRPDPDAVAYHFQQAGDERAADWLIIAGNRAERAYDWQTAIKRLEAAAVILGDTPHRHRECGYLLFQIGHLTFFADPARSLPYLARAEQLAREAGDTELALLAAVKRGFIRCYIGDVRLGLDDVEQVLRRIDAAQASAAPMSEEIAMVEQSPRTKLAWADYLMWLARSGRFAQVVRCADEHVDPQTVSAIVGDAWNGLGVAHSLRGDVANANGAFCKAMAMYESQHSFYMLAGSAVFSLMLLVLPYQTDRLDERHRLAQIAERALTRVDAVMGTTPATDMGRLPALIIEGDWELARQAAKAAFANNHDALRHYALWVLVVLARNQGEVDAARALIRELLPEGPETAPGNCFFLCGTNVQRIAAEMALGAGDLPRARAWLGAHDRWLTWSGATLGRADGALGWAAFYHASGNQSLARQHADQAFALAAEPRQPLALIAAHRFLAKLDMETQQFETAETHLQESLNLAMVCQAPFGRALTLLTLAGLRATQRQTEEARGLLAEVRAICLPLEARPTLEQVAALEAQLATRPKPSHPAGLTAREVEVLGLVAEGLTDAEVAEKLYLSPRTVSQHLRSVYNKLGVNSRTAATRFAVERGLVE